MSAFIIPLLVACGFLLLFLLTTRRPRIISETLRLESVQTSTFTFGKLAYYDNLNDKNKHHIPWVFIHSIGSSFYSWRYQIQHFSDSQRIIAVDLLGFGQSDKPILADYGLDATTVRLVEFFDALGLKKANLIGCSLGGAICLWLKNLHPDRFPKVITIAPAATPTLVRFTLVPHEKLALVGRRLVSRPLIRAALRGGLTHRHKITPDIVESYFAPFKNPDAVTCFLKSVSIIKDGRIYAGLSTIQDPVLVVWGERDRVIPRSALMKIVQQLPKAELLTHKTGGHHLMEDESEWVNKIISEYFLS